MYIIYDLFENWTRRRAFFYVQFFKKMKQIQSGQQKLETKKLYCKIYNP